MPTTKQKVKFRNRCDYAYTVRGESIFLLEDFRVAKHFLAIGKVYRISHGNKFDIVTIRTKIRTNAMRDILVYDNLARRQIYTLKAGQWCTIFGLSVIDTKEVIVKGEKKVIPNRYYYAYSIQGHYVPKSFDVNKMAGSEECDVKEMLESQEQSYQHAIDLMLDNAIFGEEDNGQ